MRGGDPPSPPDSSFLGGQQAAKFGNLSEPFGQLRRRKNLGNKITNILIAILDVSEGVD